MHVCELEIGFASHAGESRRATFTCGSQVHHFLAYDCGYLTPEELAWQGECYTDRSIPKALKECNGGVPFVSWAIGGEPFYFPSHVG